MYFDDCKKSKWGQSSDVVVGVKGLDEEGISPHLLLEDG
jgi:hypothetical protein